MEVVVIKPFMAPLGGVPARGRLAPSGDPDKPRIVQIPPWAFTRHFRLGNCVTVDAYEQRREVEREFEKAKADLRKAEEELSERALASAEVEALKEEIAALDEMDEKEALVALARQREFSVSTKGSVKAVRDRVRRELEKRLASLGASADEEPEPAAAEPEEIEERVSLDDLSVRDAAPLIEACDDAETIALWVLAERDGANRSTLLAALRDRYEQLGGSADDLDLD